MKILITGTDGFIGRNLKEHFIKGYDILCPSHDELDLLREKTVEQYFKRNKIDCVIHAAGIPYSRKIKNPKNVLTGTVKMFFNIVMNKRPAAKLIYFGSGAEYDTRYDISKVKESDLGRRIPEDDYGLAKYFLSRYAEQSENVINLRTFGVFGKYEDYEIRFISNAICKAVFDLPITIRQNRRFSYLYIDDLCRITEYFAIHQPKDKVFNVVPDETLDLLSIAAKVKSISKKNTGIIVHEKGLGKEYTGDNSMLRSILKDFKFASFNKAIKKLYDWYRVNKNTISREQLLVDP